MGADDGGGSDLLTIAETQAVLRCSRDTVYRLMRDGGLPYLQFPGRRLFRREAVDEWLKLQEVVTRTVGAKPTKPHSAGRLAKARAANARAAKAAKKELEALEVADWRIGVHVTPRLMSHGLARCVGVVRKVDGDMFCIEMVEISWRCKEPVPVGSVIRGLMDAWARV